MTTLEVRTVEELRDALDYFEKRNDRGVVVLKEGVYTGSDISLCSNVCVVGEENVVFESEEHDTSVFNLDDCFNTMLKNIGIRYDVEQVVSDHTVLIDNCHDILLENIDITNPFAGVVKRGKTETRAVFVRDSNNIEIKGCNIEFGSTYTTLSDGVSYNYGIGIGLTKSGNCNIVDNMIEECGTGVYLKNCSNILVQNNDIENAKHLIKNTCGNGGCGVLADYGEYLKINSNNIRFCEEHGIYLSGIRYSRIIGNNCNYNNYNGIQLNKGSNENDPNVEYNMIANNILVENNHFGIALFRHAYYNCVTGNICKGNKRGNIKESKGDDYFPAEEWSKGNRIECNIEN